MLNLITTQKINPDNKFLNAVDEISKGCYEIQESGVDEKLVDIATGILEKLEDLEKYYAD